MTLIEQIKKLEAALIAAEELAEAIERSDPWEVIDKALATYRKATQ